MKNKIDLREIEAVLNVLNIESLNIPVLNEEGIAVEIIDLLGDDTEAKFIRLKTFLISICRNETQGRIIELLSQQYEVEDIANKLGYTQEHVRRTVREIRNKCLKLLKKPK